MDRDEYLKKHYPGRSDWDYRPPPPPRDADDFDERYFMPIAMTLCLVVAPLALVLILATLK